MTIDGCARRLVVRRVPGTGLSRAWPVAGTGRRDAHVSRREEPGRSADCWLVCLGRVPGAFRAATVPAAGVGARRAEPGGRTVPRTGRGCARVAAGDARQSRGSSPCPLRAASGHSRRPPREPHALTLLGLRALVAGQLPHGHDPRAGVRLPIARGPARCPRPALDAPERTCANPTQIMSGRRRRVTATIAAPATTSRPPTAANRAVSLDPVAGSAPGVTG